jgi:hypothetical protein
MHKLRFRWVTAAVALIGLIVLVRWGWVSPEVSEADCRLSENGAWISVDWTSREVDETAVKELAKSAVVRKIRYFFPYTTYLKSDGTFSPTYDHAAEFVGKFRRFNHEVRLLAWIGIPLANDSPVGVKGWVNLDDRATRAKIAALAAELVDKEGFDGIHLDVETVRNDDPNFLLLLEEVKSAIGPEHMASVAGSHWTPAFLNGLPPRGLRWTDLYYQSVAERVDQIATMTYDSYAPHPAIYRLWLREQVRGISRSLSNSGATLLWGISVSREDTLSHRPGAENLSSGLAGICAGLSGLPEPNPAVRGVAIYADWEFMPTDQQIWDEWQR